MFSTRIAPIARGVPQTLGRRYASHGPTYHPPSGYLFGERVSRFCTGGTRKADECAASERAEASEGDLGVSLLFKGAVEVNKRVSTGLAGNAMPSLISYETRFSNEPKRSEGR